MNQKGGEGSSLLLDPGVHLFLTDRFHKLEKGKEKSILGDCLILYLNTCSPRTMGEKILLCLTNQEIHRVFLRAS